MIRRRENKMTDQVGIRRQCVRITHMCGLPGGQKTIGYPQLAAWRTPIELQHQTSTFEVRLGSVIQCQNVPPHPVPPNLYFRHMSCF